MGISSLCLNGELIGDDKWDMHLRLVEEGSIEVMQSIINSLGYLSSESKSQKKVKLKYQVNDSTHKQSKKLYFMFLPFEIKQEYSYNITLTS